MNTDEQQRIYNDGPMIESTVSLSKTGRALIHRTIITHIKPVAYYEAILRNARKPEVEQ